MQLYKHNLAEIQDIDVNWCENLGTVLSNEEVVLNDKNERVSERGGHPVVRKPMKQWVLKIVDYADKLLDGLNEVEFSESLKSLQRNWIGKSIGTSVQFKIKDSLLTLDVFTTRIDTIYGVQYLVVAPEHPILKSITSEQQINVVQSYIEQTKKISDLDRIADTNKTGAVSYTHLTRPTKA